MYKDEDLWTVLTEQAYTDDKLSPPMTVQGIADLWINRERLPIVSVTINYSTLAAMITQVR